MRTGTFFSIVILFMACTVLSAQVLFHRTGGLKYFYNGIEVFDGDWLQVRTADGKRADSILADPSVKTSEHQLTRKTKYITLNCTAKREGDAEVLAWDYEIAPGCDGSDFQFGIYIPTNIFPDYPEKRTIRSDENGGKIELDSFLGNFEFDFSGSTFPAVFEDFRRAEWCKRFRITVNGTSDPEKGGRGKIALRIRVRPSRSDLYLKIPVVKYGNQGLRDEVDNDGKGGWTDQGANDLRMFKPGIIAAQSIPFEIGDRVIVLKGGARPRFPESSDEIPLHDIKAERFCFVHTSAWNPRRKVKVFDYVITYADGKRETFPVMAFLDIVDWWGRNNEVLNARVAWVGKNAENMVSLYHAQWKNPHPDIPVRSIRMVSNPEQTAVPVILGITAVKAGRLTSAQYGLLDRAFMQQEKKTAPDLSAWYSCPLDWCGKTKPESALDLSWLNHKPAGKYGFLKVGGSGHFEFEQRPGETVRFWGTNVAVQGPYPAKDLAPGIARTLAAQGINLVRIHLFAASDLNRENTLIQEDGSLNPIALDKMDFFFAELTKNGIYIYMDWNDIMLFGRLMQKKFPDKHYGMIPALFSPEFSPVLKKFAVDMFTRKNPYTGLSMVENPAVALFEIVNENSMSDYRSSQALLPEHLDELDALWKRYQEANGIVPAVSLRDKNPVTQFGENGRKFLAEIQKRHLDEMYRHLRDIGCKVPICGTNLALSATDLWSSSGMDYMNDHAYAGVVHNSGAPVSNETSISDSSVFGLPFFAEFTHSKIAGKPLVGSEWCFVYPNPYRGEGMPVTAAYFSLQDWDAPIYYCAIGSFHNGMWESHRENPIIRPHSQLVDPSTMASARAAALAYRRGDISTARHTVTLGYTPSDIWNNRRYANQYSFLTQMAKVEIKLLEPGEKSSWPVTATGTHEEVFCDAAKRLGIRGAGERFVSSDTGEIKRYASPGLFIVDTPKTQMVAGAIYSLDGKERKVRDFEISSLMRFGTLTFSSLDGKDLAESSRILVSAAGNSLNNPNGDGVLAEPFLAEIGSRSTSGNPLNVYLLDPQTGERKHRLPVWQENGLETFRIGPDTQSVFFELIR